MSEPQNTAGSAYAATLPETTAAPRETRLMGFIKNLVAKAEEIIARIDGDAQRELQSVLDELKVTEEDVHGRVAELLLQAKQDIGTEVARLAPQAEQAVKDLVAKLEADVNNLLHPTEADEAKDAE